MSAHPAQDIDTANVVGHFINGQDVADANRPEPVTTPATGKVARHVAMASRQTVEEAIAAAVTGGVVSKAGEELARKGSSVLNRILGGADDS